MLIKYVSGIVSFLKDFKNIKMAKKLLNNSAWTLAFHSATSIFYLLMLFTFMSTNYVILTGRMITTWYLAFHIGFIFLRVIQDLIDVSPAKNSKLSKSLAKFQNLIFISLIFPFALYIPLVYWLLFCYNSNLMLPNFVEISLPSWVSTSAHSAIALVALMEITSFKYTYEGYNFYSLVIMCFFSAGYIACLIGTYVQYGFWLYPVFNLFPTSALPFVFLALIALLLLMYFVGKVMAQHFNATCGKNENTTNQPLQITNRDISNVKSSKSRSNVKSKGEKNTSFFETCKILLKKLIPFTSTADPISENADQRLNGENGFNESHPYSSSTKSYSTFDADKEKINKSGELPIQSKANDESTKSKKLIQSSIVSETAKSNEKNVAVDKHVLNGGIILQNNETPKKDIIDNETLKMDSKSENEKPVDSSIKISAKNSTDKSTLPDPSEKIAFNNKNNTSNDTSTTLASDKNIKQKTEGTNIERKNEKIIPQKDKIDDSVISAKTSFKSKEDNKMKSEGLNKYENIGDGNTKMGNKSPSEITFESSKKTVKKENDGEHRPSTVSISDDKVNIKPNDGNVPLKNEQFFPNQKKIVDNAKSNRQTVEKNKTKSQDKNFEAKNIENPSTRNTKIVDKSSPIFSEDDKKESLGLGNNDDNRNDRETSFTPGEEIKLKTENEKVTQGNGKILSKGNKNTSKPENRGLNYTLDMRSVRNEDIHKSKTEKKSIAKKNETFPRNGKVVDRHKSRATVPPPNEIIKTKSTSCAKSSKKSKVRDNHNKLNDEENIIIELPQEKCENGIKKKTTRDRNDGNETHSTSQQGRKLVSNRKENDGNAEQFSRSTRFETSNLCKIKELADSDDSDNLCSICESDKYVFQDHSKTFNTHSSINDETMENISLCDTSSDTNKHDEKRPKKKPNTAFHICMEIFPTISPEISSKPNSPISGRKPNVVNIENFDQEKFSLKSKKSDKFFPETKKNEKNMLWTARLSTDADKEYEINQTIKKKSPEIPSKNLSYYLINSRESSSKRSFGSLKNHSSKFDSHKPVKKQDSRKGSSNNSSEPKFKTKSGQRNSIKSHKAHSMGNTTNRRDFSDIYSNKEDIINHQKFDNLREHDSGKKLCREQHSHSSTSQLINSINFDNSETIDNTDKSMKNFSKKKKALLTHHFEPDSIDSIIENPYDEKMKNKNKMNSNDKQKHHQLFRFYCRLKPTNSDLQKKSKQKISERESLNRKLATNKIKTMKIVEDGKSQNIELKEIETNDKRLKNDPNKIKNDYDEINFSTASKEKDRSFSKIMKIEDKRRIFKDGIDKKRRNRSKSKKTSKKGLSDITTGPIEHQNFYSKCPTEVSTNRIAKKKCDKCKQLQDGGMSSESCKINNNVEKKGTYPRCLNPSLKGRNEKLQTKKSDDHKKLRKASKIIQQKQQNNSNQSKDGELKKNFSEILKNYSKGSKIGAIFSINSCKRQPNINFNADILQNFELPVLSNGAELCKFYATVTCDAERSCSSQK